MVQVVFGQKISFSLGHFYNDLCSAMWFTYMLIYFTQISNISSVKAGYLMLLGQVVDAVATPFIGYESDYSLGFFGYSKRKSWHLLGTLLVTGAFTFIFMPVLGGSHASDLGKVIYYTPFIILFQLGWASVQISHMALVTDLTSNEDERVTLNSYRNAMTLVAYMSVYGLVWLVFNKARESEWSPADETRFMILTFIVVALGITFSIFFHIFTKEHSQQEEIRLNGRQEGNMKWKDWFKEGQFYIVGLAYMGARLILNISQTYWPFYITDSLQLSKKYAAIVPLIVYISGFLTSLIAGRINSIFGRKATYLLGAIITAAALMWMALIKESTAYHIFGPAVFLGVGSTILLINGLSMIADMLGNHWNSGAFVYGVMSFVDKISSGVTLMIIQAIQPQCKGSCSETNNFFKDLMVYLLASFDLICFVVFFALIPVELGKLKKFSKGSLEPS